MNLRKIEWNLKNSENFRVWVTTKDPRVKRLVIEVVTALKPEKGKKETHHTGTNDPVYIHCTALDGQGKAVPDVKIELHEERVR